MLSLPILNQQLEYEKEVMIITQSSEDMMATYKFFKGCPTHDGIKIFNNVSFFLNHFKSQFTFHACVFFFWYIHFI